VLAAAVRGRREAGGRAGGDLLQRVVASAHPRRPLGLRLGHLVHQGPLDVGATDRATTVQGRDR
jgi:hypothetical protein